MYCCQRLHGRSWTCRWTHVASGESGSFKNGLDEADSHHLVRGRNDCYLVSCGYSHIVTEDSQAVPRVQTPHANTQKGNQKRGGIRPEARMIADGHCPTMYPAVKHELASVYWLPTNPTSSFIPVTYAFAKFERLQCQLNRLLQHVLDVIDKVFSRQS
jgi:hypothetical protein